MVRSHIKGPLVPLEDKIQQVNAYFDSENTIDAHERVLNYLEGLQMGYRGKDPDAVKRIQQEIEVYRSMFLGNLLKEPNGFITFADALKYSFEDRHALWKDLFRRNQKWLEKGYTQKEINDFMDVLQDIFKRNGETVDKLYSFDKLKQLRATAATTTNTHKFFF